jgi:hypothetical protein
MPKYLDIVRAIERRVVVGDYVLNNLPGERKLAMEFGVSHMTARKAVQHLVGNGTLMRDASGNRTTQPRPSAVEKKCVAYVAPAFESGGTTTWYYALNNLMKRHHGVVRPVLYTHEADPAIHEALTGDFAGVFIIPPHRTSRLLLQHMVRERSRIVTLWHDLTEHGIPCIEVSPPRATAKLVEYLESLGHRSIDCLNTEPNNVVISARIQSWNSAIKARGLKGELHNHPVEPFQHSGIAAYDYMHRRLAAGPLSATAVVCVTNSAAIGLSRACGEAGVKIGRDLSICGVGEFALARLQTPSLTIVKPADFETYLSMGLDWIQSGGKDTGRSLRFEPDDVPLWIGESTGLAPG